MSTPPPKTGRHIQFNNLRNRWEYPVWELLALHLKHNPASASPAENQDIEIFFPEEKIVLHGRFLDVLYGRLVIQPAMEIVLNAVVDDLGTVTRIERIP